MKIKCLIIDDEPLAAEVIQSHLKEFSNMELVGTFANPIDALKTLEENKIDVVFTDINMPKMSGLDFIRNTDSVPIFIITNYFR